MHRAGDSESGKLTIEQFLVVLKHLHSATANQGNSNVGLVPLLIARYGHCVWSCCFLCYDAL